MNTDIAEIVAAAEARAAEAVRQGIADLRVQVAHAPEWKVTTAFNGARIVEPERAMLAGMLAFIESNGASA